MLWSLICVLVMASSPMEEDVRGWIASLEAPTLHARRTARERLLLAGEKARPLIEAALPGASYAVRRDLEYVLAYAAKPPSFCRIPGGDVSLGSDERKDKNPTYQATLKPFEIGQFEVTCLEYRLFLTTTDLPDPSQWLEGLYPYGSESLPVTGITFDEARLCAAFYGCRLPTEEEWELAARGTDGRIYPWGSAEQFEPGMAHISRGRLAVRGARAMSVGSFPGDKSPYDVRDMVGNVREWVQVSKSRDPRGLGVKGGFYASPIQASRPSMRAFAMPGDRRIGNIGFRLARDL